MRRPARVILLNGPGSVDKTSVARALQARATGPLLHVQMDTFLDMLPDRCFADAAVVRFQTCAENGHVVTTIETGTLGPALLTAMRRSVAALAGQGFDVVVDDVWLDREPADYAGLLFGFQVLRVGLTAPLDVLEAREAERGDRLPGLSRAQVGRVHAGVSYDVLLDTSAMSPDAAAQRIADISGL